MPEQQRESPRATLRRLQRAQKPPHGTAAYSRFVNRPVGRLFAVAAYHAGLSPNAVSLISAGFTFTGLAVVAAAAPHPVTSVLAGLMLVVGYAVDSADGQVARLTGRSSRLGEWLDHTIDSIKMQAIHLVILVHLYRWYAGMPDSVLLIPLAFSVAANVVYFGMMLVEQMRLARGEARDRPGAKSLSVTRSLTMLPMDFGALAVVVGTLYWHRVFLAGYGILLLGTVAALVAALRKWSVELASVDACAAAPSVSAGATWSPSPQAVPPTAPR